MPDAATTLQILGSALNGPPPAAPAVVPDVPWPGESPQHATLRSIQAAQAANSGGMSLNDKLAVINQARQGKLNYTPPQSGETSAARVVGNVGAGFNEALAGTLGAPVDLAAKFLKLGLYGPHDVPSALDHPLGGSESLKQGYGAATQAVGLPNGNPESYPANTPLERVARAGGQGIESMLVPYGAARTVSALGIQPTSTLGRAAMTMGQGTPASNAAVGFGAGAGGEIAAQNVPEPYKPLARLGGQLAGGGVTALARAAYDVGGRLASTYIKPMAANLPIVRPAIKRSVAAQRLASGASDVGAVKGLLDAGAGNEMVPGSQPTLGQATGDQGLLGLERAQATRNPSPFLERRAQQNLARTNALDAAAPEGSSSSALTDHIARLRDAEDANTASILQQAQDAARAKVAALGGGAGSDVYGATIRDELASAKAAAKANESMLWRSIDPQGNLNIAAAPTAEIAKQVAGAMPKLAAPMGGEEAAIFQAARNLPGVVPFSEFSALRSRLLDAIRNERFQNGDTPALRRMQLLRGAMDNNIASAGMGAETAAAARPAAAPSAAPVNAPSVGQSVFTPSGREIRTRYEVVPGNSLVASHTQDLRENPAFPSELQPRERARAASEAQIGAMAAGLQPERLGASASAVEGAPIIGPDGVVESGNARTLAILRAYQQGGKSAQAYRDFLQRQGFNVEGIDNPVLVRRRLSEMTPDERVRFSVEANASPGLALSATERGLADAERLAPDTLDLFKGGDLGSAENVRFVRAFAKQVLDRGEEGNFVDANGRLSLDGARRVETALLAKAYGDSNLIGQLAETGDESVKAFGNALRDASGSVAKLNADISAGRVPAEFDISAPLVEASRIVQKARASRTPLADVVAQGDAFNRISPMAESLLREAYGPDLRGRINRVKFSNLLCYYAGEAGKVSTEASLFASEVTPQAIIAAGAKRYGGLFGQQAATPSIGAAGNASAGARNGESGPQAFRPGNDAAGPQAPGRESGAATPGKPQGLLGPSEPEANFGPENAQAYRAAANATRERAATFNTNPVGQVLRKAPGGEYNMADSRVAGKFFRSGAGALEDAEALVKAVGDRPRAIAALQDYAASDLAAKASRPDGTLDPVKFQRWMENHADALRAFPEFSAKFRDAASAETAIADAMTARREALDAFSKGVAAKFIGSDPVVAVDSVLRSKDPAGGMRELVDLVHDNPDAVAGLKRAIIDSIQRKAVGNELAGQTESTFLKSDTFQTFVKRNDAALSEVFSPEEMDNLRAIAADLQRSNRSVTAAKLPGSPGTASDLIGAGKSAAAAGEHRGSLLGYILALAGEHVTGSVAPFVGLIGAKVGSAIRNAGLAKADDLVTEALLNPELARTLLEEVTPATARNRAGTLAAQLRAMSVAVPGFNPAMPAQKDRG